MCAERCEAAKLFRDLATASDAKLRQNLEIESSESAKEIILERVPTTTQDGDVHVTIPAQEGEYGPDDSADVFEMVLEDEVVWKEEQIDVEEEEVIIDNEVIVEEEEDEQAEEGEEENEGEIVIEEGEEYDQIVYETFPIDSECSSVKEVIQMSSSSPKKKPPVQVRSSFCSPNISLNSPYLYRTSSANSAKTLSVLE